ncbi:hypothetical protein [Chitinophaga sancti]|uniref:Chloramphenicol 3-O phosphotransferase n=1 Tax=Chitinophaga sancti TaxID=1004 RepID=A0A1K1S2A3_9BACT|nr:hypothetical protein [Chitinophaga sancti]WQD59652.1 hypothetical protein U0033_17330 [Chitinophaga sancti]WQG88217.1 hypothetical protein SR876_25135 [Chitinophaga sancti]SFW78457.1 hypothetical protein SAMN05661012_04654 [Chitinophaga sancti]
MQKTLIAINGTASTGKSSSIKAIVNNIHTYFPQATIEFIISDGDINVLVKIGEVIIGIESQGDPNSRLQKSLADFAELNCDIIICASRTSGMTVDWIDSMFSKCNYDIIWTSNYFSNELSSDFLNNIFAESILQLIKKLIDTEKDLVQSSKIGEKQHSSDQVVIG